MWQEVEEEPWEMEEAVSSGDSGDASSAFSDTSAYSTVSAHSDTAPSTYTYTDSALSPTATATATSSAQSEPYMDTESSIPEEEEEEEASASPEAEKQAKPSSARVAKAARFLGLLFIAAIAAVVVFEVFAWYKFYDSPDASVKSWGPGWTTWLRHPLSPFKPRLNAVAVSGNSNQIKDVKRKLKRAYMLLGDGKGQDSWKELLKWAATAWSSYIAQALRDPQQRAQLAVERGPVWVREVERLLASGSQAEKMELALAEARPYLLKLKEETGPGADGLDWWLALGGAGLAVLCSVLAFAGDHMQVRWGRVVHALACCSGIALCFTLGSIYAYWLIEAASDVFGTEYMLCPLLYCLLFFAAGLSFTVDELVAFQSY